FLLEMLQTNQIPLPAIFWVHWTEGAKRLKSALDKQTQLDGEMIIGEVIPEERMRYVDMFQAGELDYLIMSITTGKHGLSLTRAESAVYIDKIWDADAYVQSGWR